MQEPLPLSWTKAALARPVYRHRLLHYSGTSWVTFADLPFRYTLSDVQADLEARFPGGFLVRGCCHSAAVFLSRKGGGVLKTGAEALLDPRNGHLGKRSLSALVRQAGKKGTTVEVPLDDDNLLRLSELRREGRHGSKPQLEHVFRTVPCSRCRCFAFVSGNGSWLAAMTVTMRDERCAHTELMVKRAESPACVMEGLVAGVFSRFGEEGVREWSLGEVPFLSSRSSRRSGSRPEDLLLAVTAGVSRHVYDADGLYRFKNKFTPRWRDVYLCASRGLSLQTLVDLAVETRYARLLAHGLAEVFMSPFGFVHRTAKP